MSMIASRDNARVRRWRDLARDAKARRQAGAALLEGPKVIETCLDAQVPVKCIVLCEGAEGKFRSLARRANVDPVVVSNAVFRSIADTETPAGVLAEIALPKPPEDLERAAGCVFLEAIQDAGNVGAILRTAAAFGITHAVLGKGCADAWSPKVLRAGAGAHFALKLTESADLARSVDRFAGRVVATVVAGGTPLPEADLTGRIGWLLGAEGQGLSQRALEWSDLQVTIPMRAGAESLNVAAAAAVCLYAASLSRRGARS